MLVSQPVAQPVAQTTVRTEKPQSDGNSRDAEARGNFVRGVLQYIAQQTNLPQIRREARDSSGDKTSHLLPGVMLFGIIAARGEAAANGFFVRGSRFFQRNVFALATLANQVNRGVRGNARYPRMEIVFAFVLLPGKLAEARKGFKESFLTRIFGVRGITGHA